jgi:hypothetical protein
MPNHNPPGYVSPHNRKLKSYNVHLRPETLAAFKQAAARIGLSHRQASEYAYRASREHAIDIAPHPGPNGAKPPTLDNC